MGKGYWLFKVRTRNWHCASKNYRGGQTLLERIVQVIFIKSIEGISGENQLARLEKIEKSKSSILSSKGKKTHLKIKDKRLNPIDKEVK